MEDQVSAEEKSFKKLAGVPTHYARPPVATYGTIGRPHTFRCTNAFFAALEDAFAELWDVCPAGKPDAVVSAGAQVPKPGQHGNGSAFDLDGLFWPARSFVALRFAEYPTFYLGVEAVLRRHFGTVLNHFYNADHRDHLHVDTGSPVGLRRVRTIALFVQLMSRHVLGVEIGVDGAWGPDTDAALVRLCDELDQTQDLDEVENWRAFLLACAGRAFELALPTDLLVAEEEGAERLLQGVYAVIGNELAGSPSRKAIETALTGFAAHPRIRAALKKT
jgi:hypothetical protein